MRGVVRAVGVILVGLAAMQLGGCPLPTGVSGDVIQGGTGDTALVTGSASVEVLTPPSDLSITGGTQVEVNWRAFARTHFSVLDVFIDEDQDPDNGNEIISFANLDLGESSALVDTTFLLHGTYYLGVRLEETGVIVAFDYAPGRITVDQRPVITFLSPPDAGVFGARNNVALDRTEKIAARFDVRWELSDPDSVNAVDIYLDPDEALNGNEVLLYHSTSQTGDAFTFDLPTALFEAGTYRLLAVVSDGLNAFPFYAPGSIRLRARLAGVIDLRDIDLADNPARGAVFEGFNPRDNAGSFVNHVQDIDGDGFDDLIILAQFGKPRYAINIQRVGVGEGYLIYGRRKPFSGVNNLNSTGTLFRGEIYGGVPEVPDPIRPTRGITSFTVLTDWEGDGRRDFAFGLPFTDSSPVTVMDQAGYFRTGGVVVVSTTSLGNFAGQNYYNLAEFGTEWVGAFECPDADTVECPEGFFGPKAPSPPCGGTGSTLFYENYGVRVSPLFLGCRISTAGFGDQCGESVSTYPFYGGFT